MTEGNGNFVKDIRILRVDGTEREVIVDIRGPCTQPGCHVSGCKGGYQIFRTAFAYGSRTEMKRDVRIRLGFLLQELGKTLMAHGEAETILPERL